MYGQATPHCLYNSPVYNEGLFIIIYRGGEGRGGEGRGGEGRGGEGRGGEGRGGEGRGGEGRGGEGRGGEGRGGEGRGGVATCMVKRVLRVGERELAAREESEGRMRCLIFLVSRCWKKFEPWDP